MVCHLVATHTFARSEADARALPTEVFDPFATAEDHVLLQSILTWADLTTGPTGETVTVEERVDEILSRYPTTDVVHRHVLASRAMLLVAGAHPLGLLEFTEDQQCRESRTPIDPTEL